MSTVLRLHYAPDNASLCVRLALEELQLDYDTCLVDRRRQAHKSADFLALNPNGVIPVLETVHGPMFETAAILLWLADKQGRLMPAPQDTARAHATQWLFWLSNTLHPTLRTLFYPSHYIDAGIEALRRKSRARLTAHLDLLDAAPNADWLDCQEATVQGCYLGPMLRWSALYGGQQGRFDLTRWPRLLAFAKRTEARDAVMRASVAEGLGPTPFSDPSPCDPPEGSAL